jgi:clan AA aspartic protease (TIGR02281 family)
MSVNELFALLQTLQSRQKYVDLKLPLREYLKLYPNDYKAWLIEADFILHTEPLSSAIVFYYDLLEKMLPEVEENKVTRIIQLNTSKAIQQLSRDTAWDLLATFIEPLLQIDPLNRGYIMALAKAYGKQGQATLMEDALAALPYDDPRAQQLRNSIYSPTAADIPDEVQNEVTETASLSKRKVPVLGNGQQFFVRTKIDSYSQLLLVDTGATTTAISNRVFIKLPESDKEFVGRFTVQTAGGNIEAPLFKLTAITLGDITINNVSVIILPDESFSGTFQGLLGMNVLKNFDFRFDPEKQQMTLFER